MPTMPPHPRPPPTTHRYIPHRCLYTIHPILLGSYHMPNIPYAFSRDTHDTSSNILHIPTAFNNELHATSPGDITIIYRFRPGWADIEIESNHINDEQFNTLTDMTATFLETLELPLDPYDRILTLYINTQDPSQNTFTIEDD